MSILVYAILIPTLLLLAAGVAWVGHGVFVMGKAALGGDKANTPD